MFLKCYIKQFVIWYILKLYTINHVKNIYECKNKNNNPHSCANQDLVRVLKIRK